MASLSPVGSINRDTIGLTYDSKLLSEIPHYDTYHETDVLNFIVQETEYTEHLVTYNDSCDNNVISYADYMVTIENDVAQYVSPPEQDNDMILSVIEQMKSQVERCNTVNQETKNVNESLSIFYNDAHKTALGYQNTLYLRKAQRKQSVLYSAKALVEKHDPISVCDSEETLIIAEESRLKMKDKQEENNDKPIDYAKLNKLYEYFVPQKQLFAEQVYRSPVSKPTPSVSVTKPTPTKVFPKKLPTTGMVKVNLKNAKDLLDKFDACITKRTVLFAVQGRNWGVMHIKGAFEEDIIQFFRNLRESFNILKWVFTKRINNKSFEITDTKAQLQDKSIVVNELKQLLATLKGKSQVTPNETSNLDSRFQKIEDENVSLDFKVSSLVKEREHLKRVSYTNASGSQPKSGTRNDRIQRPSSRNEKNKIVEIVLLYLDSGCSKHMIGQRDKLIISSPSSSVAKEGFVRGLPKLKYTKDHLCSASQMGKSIKECHKPKPEPSTKEKLQMLHMDLCEPMRVESINRKSLKATVIYLRTYNDTEFINQTLRAYTDDVGITHHTSVTRTPQQNNVVERRNRILVEATRTMLIFSKSSLFLWAKAVATACYTENRSLIHTRYNKTPYELLRDRKPDLKYLHIFGVLCYPTNDSEDIGKLKPKADIRIFIGYLPSKKAYRIYNKRTQIIMETIHVQFDELNRMSFEQLSSGSELQHLTSGHISSGLVPNQVASTSAKPPSKNDLDLLFQPMFDEYFKHSPSGVSMYVSPATLPPPDTAGASPFTTIEQDAPSPSGVQIFQLTEPTIEQDAPSPSTSLTTKTTTNPILATNVKEPNNKDAEFDSDTFTNPFAPLVTSSAESSSRIVDTLNMHTFQQPQTYIRRWTKDNPLVTIISNPSKSISTRHQLATDAMWCYFYAFLTKVEPKNYKEAIKESCWIEAMQEEIHEFE
ncbi:retrovirus-related pol polyprotein from transposon TNT 1-94 [Tanacetum coccineum]